MKGPDIMKAPMFMETFCRKCVEAGASVVLGHGPHQLRGVECWKGGVIFYSIGNFIFETETIARQPFDAFANKNLPQDTKIGAYMNHRSGNGTKGDVINPEVWRAVLPSWTVEDGKITEMRLYPVDLGMTTARPRRGVPFTQPAASRIASAFFGSYPRTVKGMSQYGTFFAKSVSAAASVPWRIPWTIASRLTAY